MVRVRPPAPLNLIKIKYGRVPEWPKGADCKSVVSDFGGPNPPSPTRLSLDAIRVQTHFFFSGKLLAFNPVSKMAAPSK